MLSRARVCRSASAAPNVHLPAPRAPADEARHTYVAWVAYEGTEYKGFQVQLPPPAGDAPDAAAGQAEAPDSQNPAEEAESDGAAVLLPGSAGAAGLRRGAVGRRGAAANAAARARRGSARARRAGPPPTVQVLGGLS